jgi:hypothetical protein
MGTHSLNNRTLIARSDFDSISAFTDRPADWLHKHEAAATSRPSNRKEYRDHNTSLRRAFVRRLPASKRDRAPRI